MADRSVLSRENQRRFDLFATMVFISNSQQYEFEQAGIGSSSSWESVVNGIRWMVAKPGIRQWFDENRSAFGQEFCDFHEGLVREAEAGDRASVARRRR